MHSYIGPFNFFYASYNFLQNKALNFMVAMNCPNFLHQTIHRFYMTVSLNGVILSSNYDIHSHFLQLISFYSLCLFYCRRRICVYTSWCFVHFRRVHKLALFVFVFMIEEHDLLSSLLSLFLHLVKVCSSRRKSNC